MGTIILKLILAGVFTFGLVHCRSYEEVISGDVSLLYTSDNYTYTNFVLEVLQRNYIVFKVKACSDVHVALLDHHTEYNQLIEVVIGGWTNSLSKIRYMSQGDTLTEAYTLDILHCAEFRTFWIHWSSHVSVGKGSRYYQQEIMSTPREHHRFDIHAAAMSTGFGHTGAWEITQGIGYHLFTYTPDIFPEAFQYVTRSVERAYGFFTFRARACHDLHIAMGPEIGTWKYRANFCAWGDTKTCVFYQGTTNCANTTNVCDCDTERPYWISWKDNVIRMGKGHRIHASTLYEYTPPVWHTVSYLSFSTGWGSDGTWIFNEDLENSWAMKGVNNGGNNAFENWLGTSKHNFIPFGVEACGDAYIMLSNQLGEVGDAYTIFIAKGNMTTGLSRGLSGEELVKEETPNLLDCQMALPFWISFADKTIRLGRGLNYGWFQIFEYQIPDETFEVYAVGLGTQGSKVIWTVKKNHADMFYSLTPPSYGQRNLWMTVRQDYVTYVNIQGQKNAVLFISETPGYPDDYGYELVIGYDTSKMLLRQKRGDDYATIHETDVGEVLSETEWRMFWVSWKDGYIKAGSGWQYGQRVLIESPEYIPHIINGVGLSALYDDVIKWEMEGEQGDYFSMRTDTHDASVEFGYRWAHVRDTHDHGYWLYFQVAGGGACLCLSRTYRNADGSYIIHIGTDENTKIQMWHWEGALVAEATEPGIIHVDEMRIFWVSWQNGEIKVGKGRYRNQNIMLSHTDSKFGDIEGIGMGGLNGYVANWRFSEIQGLSEFSFQTNSLEDNQQLWMSLLRKTDMVFSVQACKEVHLWFGSIMYSESWYDSYLIVLQNGSDYSYISTPWNNGQGMNRIIEVEASTPGLLSCTEERLFWVSWQSRELIIGTGGNLGQNILMSIHHYNPIPIRAFSVHTYSNTGIFRFPVSSSSFTETPPVEDNSLSGGEVFAAVLGFIILTTLFVGAIYLIIRPPQQLQKYLAPPPKASSGTSAGTSRHIAENQLRENKSPSSFENPLTVTESNVAGGY